MINFHPTRELLEAHCAAQLPLSLSVAVGAHIEMCPVCQAKVEEITELQATDSWDEALPDDIDFSGMLENIIEQPIPTISAINKKPSQKTMVAGKAYQLPMAFRSFNHLKWTKLGPVSRARVNKDDQQIRSSLLHIDKDGRIPQHQHKGYELTLLLDGSFEDEHGVYNKGDFIWLSGDVKHSPYTKEGCLCFAVQDAPLHFSGGISQVFNPLAGLMY